MNISLLGSTGSIGRQTADVARMQGYNIVAVAADKNYMEVENQIREFHPAFAAMRDERAARELRARVADTPTVVYGGESAVCEAAAHTDADVTVNAVVGIAGLAPTMAAVNNGKKIALANKETLVAGGEMVMSAAAEKGVQIIPVDSEHSAIFQCLAGNRRTDLKKIILTASGGPFFGKTAAELEGVTPEMALHHPNWNMGPKVTVDSSTLMNKGLEVIEAMWLFGVSADRIQVVIHRQSIVHSMVEFSDNSVIAQLGVPDMRLPIQYALSYPARLPSPVKEMSLTDYQMLTFFPPDTKTFRCLQICIEAARAGGLKPCAANSANEEAVGLFLSGAIKYTDIPDLVEMAVNRQPAGERVTSESIGCADREARRCVIETVKG